MAVRPDDVAAFHDAGPDHYWWMVGDHLEITADGEAPSSGAVYAMPWDEAWFAQWGGDWQAAADQLNALLADVQEIP